jgi:hypothetical protein
VKNTVCVIKKKTVFELKSRLYMAKKRINMKKIKRKKKTPKLRAGCGGTYL